MQVSRNAENLIADLARQQGVPKLEFDADGLIPIRLGGETQIAIGYSPTNDALLLFGVADAAPDPAGLDCWDIFRRNAPLAERRTRLAVDPATGALVMCCDTYVDGLDFPRFAHIMDRFVDDLGAAAGKAGKTSIRGAPPVVAEPLTVSDQMVVFWP